MARSIRQEITRLVRVCGALVADVAEFKTQIGPVGPEGEPGLAGPGGTPGPIGECGPQGTAGPQGTEGASGAVGERGPQGDLGSRGPNGLPGDTGVRGKTGTQGTRGSAGVRGPKGDKGDMGKRGPKGDKGASVTGVRIKGADLVVDIDGVPRRVGRVVVPVQAAGGMVVGGGHGGITGADPPVTVTSDYAVGGSELVIVDASAADVAIDLSDPQRGKYKFKRKDSSVYEVSFGAAVIDGDTTFALARQHETVTIERDGTDWWIT